MNAVELLEWAAWSPGVETRTEWLAWAAEPYPLAREGAPPVRFLPALQRRRCDPLSRMCLHVAHECCPESLRAEVLSVFASRHGSFANMTSMLRGLAAENPISPARFSHSVHNTQAGLFSIWSGNRSASTCVAARDETFGAGFLEGLGMLQRHPGRPLLLVTGDEPVPEPFRSRADDDHGAYALALLLRTRVEDETPAIELRLDANGTSPHRGPPDALSFLRWLLSGSAGPAELRLPHASRTWVWRRV